MPEPKNVYVKCDVLDELPEQTRDNWLSEMKLLSKELAQNATVLQVGSMDGTRIIKLLNVRPDLKLTGIEIEAALVELANKKVAEAGLTAQFIHGDITQPPKSPLFDYVICLNNTLGYIPEQQEAIQGMKSLGKNVIISIYGEKFDNKLAREYFKSIDLEIDHIDNNTIVLKEFTKVKRYTKEEIDSWNCKITETPIGYFCSLQLSES